MLSPSQETGRLSFLGADRRDRHNADREGQLAMNPSVLPARSVKGIVHTCIYTFLLVCFSTGLSFLILWSL